jgi:hypothetical protein
VPCKFPYYIDLDKLCSEPVTFDPSRKLLTVRKCKVEMGEPIVYLDKVEVEEKAKPWLRTNGAWLEVKETALQKCVASAREEGLNNLPTEVSAGKAELQALLRRLLSLSDPDIRVVVE